MIPAVSPWGWPPRAWFPHCGCPPGLTCVSVPSVLSPALGTVLAPSWQQSKSFSIAASGGPWMVSGWGGPCWHPKSCTHKFCTPLSCTLLPSTPSPCTPTSSTLYPCTEHPPSPEPLCSAPPDPALMVCTPVFCTPTPPDPAPLNPAPPIQLCTPQNCTSGLSTPSLRTPPAPRPQPRSPLPEPLGAGRAPLPLSLRAGGTEVIKGAVSRPPCSRTPRSCPHSSVPATRASSQHPDPRSTRHTPTRTAP